MAEREADVQRLIAKMAKGKRKAVEALGDLLIAAADPAELTWRSRSPAMQALTRAATHGDHSAGYQLMLWVDRMRDVFSDQPDLLADIADFAGTETEYDAVQWWVEAADLGSTKAMRYLSSWCSEVEEPEDAIDWMKRAAEAGDDEAPCMVALLLRELGRDDEASVWVERAALAGWPQALSDVSLRLLVNGEHERAIDLFDTAAPACARRTTEGPEVDQRFSLSYDRTVLLRHWLAARSLDALHRLARGGSDESAAAVWERGRDRGDFWSSIHLAVLAASRGQSETATGSLALIGRRDRRLARAFFNAGVQGTGWFRDWAREGLNLLASLPPPSSRAPGQPQDGTQTQWEASSLDARGWSDLNAPGASDLLGAPTGRDYPAARENLEAAAESGDDSAALQLGAVLEQEGWGDEAVDWYDRAAVAGWPNALGSVTWHHLLRGDHHACLDAFERARPACQARLQSLSSADPDVDWLPEQWLNARSNVALSRLALGGPPYEALAVWVEGAAMGHAESLVFPAILAMRGGREREAYLGIARMPRDQRINAREALVDGVAGEGWFSDWCQDGLKLLDSCPSMQGETVQIGLTAEEAIILRSFLHDRFDGPYCGPRGALEEVDLKLASQLIPIVPVSICINDMGHLALEPLASQQASTEVLVPDPTAEIHLQLTQAEACLINTLAGFHVAVSGLGEIIGRVHHKLSAAGASQASLTLRPQAENRIRISVDFGSGEGLADI